MQKEAEAKVKRPSVLRLPTGEVKQGGQPKVLVDLSHLRGKATEIHKLCSTIRQLLEKARKSDEISLSGGHDRKKVIDESKGNPAENLRNEFERRIDELKRWTDENISSVVAKVQTVKLE